LKPPTRTSVHSVNGSPVHHHYNVTINSGCDCRVNNKTTMEHGGTGESGLTGMQHGRHPKYWGGPIKPSDDPLGRGREQVHSGSRFCFLGATLYILYVPLIQQTTAGYLVVDAPLQGTWTPEFEGIFFPVVQKVHPPIMRENHQ